MNGLKWSRRNVKAHGSGRAWNTAELSQRLLPLQRSVTAEVSRRRLALFGDHITPIGWAGIATIVTSGILATILRARTLPNTPAEDH